MLLSTVTVTNIRYQLCVHSSVYPEVVTTTLKNGLEILTEMPIWQRRSGYVSALLIKLMATDGCGYGWNTRIYIEILKLF